MGFAGGGLPARSTLDTGQWRQALTPHPPPRHQGRKGQIRSGSGIRSRVDQAFVCIRHLRDTRESRLGAHQRHRAGHHRRGSPRRGVRGPGQHPFNVRGARVRVEPFPLEPVHSLCDQLIPCTTRSFPARPGHGPRDRPLPRRARRVLGAADDSNVLSPVRARRRRARLPLNRETATNERRYLP